MGTFFMLIGLLGISFSWGMKDNPQFKEKTKKKIFVIVGVSLIALLGGCAEKANPILKLDAKVFDTNNQGVAIIKGKTDKDSNVTIDGKDIPVKGSHFSYKYTLQKGKQKKLKVVATNKEKIDILKTVTVKPSKAFIASLDKKNNEQLTKVDDALKKAEKTPTQVNYDEAATLVASLSKEYNQYTKRLKTIKKHIPIYEALAQAEKTKSKADYEQATALVSKANLNKKTWKKRLATVKQDIEEKERQEQLIAAATAAVAKAEEEPTNEALNEAIAKVNSLSTTNNSLADRIDHVKKQLEAHKAQQVAEAAKKAEAQQRAQAEAAQQAEAARQAQVQAAQTPTEPEAGKTIKGSKNGIYHVPGSTYYDRTTNPVAWFSTVEEAEAAGFRPPKR